MKTLIPTFLFVMFYTLMSGQYSPNVSVETRGINWPNSVAENCNGLGTGYNPSLCPTYNVSGMNWYMSGIAGQNFSFSFSNLAGIANRDYAMVNGGVIEVRDPNSDICFNSPVINIAGLGTVTMSFVCTRPGTGSTYVHVNFRYRVNGGPVVSSGNLTGGTGVTSTWSPTATGSTLEIWACMNATGNNDVYNLTSMNTNVGSPLPVKWSGFFIAPTEKGHSQLYWQTASEINNDYFEIERSMDGIQFSAIGRIKGSGNRSEPTNYSYLDETAKAGNTYYYRVKQVDFDGTEDFSTVLNITIKGLALGIAVSPNPTDDFIRIELDEVLESTMFLDVLDLNGRVIRTITIEEGAYVHQVDLSDLADGLYVLKSKGSDAIHQKIVKSAY